MMWVSSVIKRNKQDGKRALNYEVRKNELGQKDDHPKDPLNRSP
jgi:hypothetical protein